MGKRDSVKKQGQDWRKEQSWKAGQRSSLILKEETVDCQGVKSPKCAREEDAELWQDIKGPSSQVTILPWTKQPLRRLSCLK